MTNEHVKVLEDLLGILNGHNSTGAATRWVAVLSVGECNFDKTEAWALSENRRYLYQLGDGLHVN
jgi:hypothetical protein